MPGALWKNQDVNTDNVLQSFIFLFILTTTEGWPNYLLNFIDAGDLDGEGNGTGPIYKNNMYIFLNNMNTIFITKKQLL